MNECFNTKQMFRKMLVNKPWEMAHLARRASLGEAHMATLQPKKMESSVGLLQVNGDENNGNRAVHEGHIAGGKLLWYIQSYVNTQTDPRFELLKSFNFISERNPSLIRKCDHWKSHGCHPQPPRPPDPELPEVQNLEPQSGEIQGRNERISPHGLIFITSILATRLFWSKKGVTHMYQ